jgi:hypothetical protein
MNARIRTLTILLTVFIILTLAGCISFGEPLNAEDQEKIDQQIREAIEKTFPLPEQVIIKTHVGDDLRFATDLNLDQVVSFYRDAYNQKGYEEGGDSQVLTESATLLFMKNGDKDVTLEITTKEKGCEVHIALKDR